MVRQRVVWRLLKCMNVCSLGSWLNIKMFITFTWSRLFKQIVRAYQPAFELMMLIFCVYVNVFFFCRQNILLKRFFNWSGELSRGQEETGILAGAPNSINWGSELCVGILFLQYFQKNEKWAALNWNMFLYLTERSWATETSWNEDWCGERNVSLIV